MDIRTKVAFLSRPETYPDGRAAVKVIETHMSWVFLTPRYAYKLKKPVRYAYLDFRTVDARHWDCLEEVRLNRRLAAGVYLGVLPLTVDHGRLALTGTGEVVDWLVHMRRLPADAMLDHLLRERAATLEQARELGHLLADFYRSEPRVEMTIAELCTRMRDDISENLRELSDPMFALPRERIASLCRLQEGFLDRHGDVFERRLAQGRIVEGHGDLRPEHVCFNPLPVIIDCLEFKREFRLLDAADDLAYLALECERLGAPEFGAAVKNGYEELTGDDPPAPLWNFYQSFRALLRAKIAAWHNRDDDAKDPERWIRRAGEYLDLAERHASALH